MHHEPELTGGVGSIGDAAEDGGRSLTKRLKELLDATELLVVYACRNAVKPEGFDDQEFSKLIKDVVTGKDRVASGKAKPEEEADFLANFRQLARAIQPVTVRSIQDSVWEESLPSTKAPPKWFPWLRMSPASAAIMRFTLTSLLALLLLLGFQILWVIGGSLLSSLDSQEKIAATETKSALEQAKPKEEKPPGASAELRTADEVASTPPVRREIIADDGKANEALERMAAFQALVKWWDFWPGTDQIDAKSPSDTIAKNKSIVFASREIVKILEVYLLPLLYGLLGACTYVLREVSAEKRERRFRSETEIAYWVRIFLGLLAGLLIGWFVQPEAQVGYLPAFAIAYVAGYSVELLFSAMDRLVMAFGSTSKQSVS